MAEQLKVLGQLAPAATTLSDLYTCASSRGASVSTISVCNRGTTVAAFRVAVAVAGAADNVKQYVYYDISLGGKNTFTATIGISLQNSDVVRVYASNANLSFNIFGVELS